MQSFSYAMVTLLSLWAITAIHAADDDHTFLQHISTLINPNDAQKEIRTHTRDNEEACLALVNAARNKNNPVAELYCVAAHRVMKNAYNFSTLAYHHIDHHNDVWDKILKNEVKNADYYPTRKANLERAKQVVKSASQQGNLFAKLIEILERGAEWGARSKPNFWHACQIRALKKPDDTFPFPEMEYQYGRALCTCASAKARKAGLYHMQESGLCVVDPSEKLKWAAEPSTAFFDLLDIHDIHDIHYILEKRQLCIEQWPECLTIKHMHKSHNHVIIETETPQKCWPNDCDHCKIHQGNDPQGERDMALLVAFLRDALNRCGKSWHVKRMVDELCSYAEISNCFTSPSVFLQRIAQQTDPDDAQKKIRLYAQGNRATCLALCKEAIESNNYPAELYCVGAYNALEWSQDDTKDFNIVSHKGKLESYRFAPTHIRRHQQLYTIMQEQDLLPKQTDQAIAQRIETVIQRALEKGNSFAQLIQIYDQCADPEKKLNVWHAYRISTCKQKGTFPFPEMEYAYGKALANNKHKEVQRIGLRHTLASTFCKKKIRDWDRNVSGPTLKKYLQNLKLDTHPHYKEDGMFFVSDGSRFDYVIAPTYSHWEKFEKQHLTKQMSSRFFRPFKKYRIHEMCQTIEKHALTVMPYNENTIAVLCPVEANNFNLARDCPRLTKFLHAMGGLDSSQAVINMIEECRQHPELLYELQYNTRRTSHETML